MDLYTEKKIYMILMFLVLIGGLNLGIVGICNFNVIEKLNQITNKFEISKIVYVVIGLSALFLITKRDVYLPFLGDTVYPCDSLKEHIPNNHTEKTKVKVPPYAVVVYWAAEPETETMVHESNPLVAYQKYENSGVVKADENGEAILKFRKPQEYTVPNMGISSKKLKPHVHYRYCKYPGMLSPVYTKKVCD
jgi:uncharacterized membrane protein YuzA (DUF378 family)